MSSPPGPLPFDRFLVSGSEGDIAQSIALTLRDIGKVGRLFGCDMHRLVVSPYYFDESFRVPAARDGAYLARITEAIRENQIAIFIPTAEAEIEFLCGLDDVEGLLGCRVVIVGRDVARICLDKLATVECLKRHSIDAPVTLDLSQSGNVGFPCIVKPRKGRGSKGIQILRNEGELADCRRSRVDGCVLQELIGTEDREYTVGLFVSSLGVTRVLSLRRELERSGGATVCGEVANSPEILGYASAIGEALGLVGSVNVQLRVGPSGPMAFEINPRLSSTVRFRHLLGFKDLQWWLEDLAGVSVSDYESPANGTRFLRQATAIVLQD